MRDLGVRTVAFACVLALFGAACSGDDDTSDGAATRAREPVDLAGFDAATFTAHGSVEQVWLTGTDPNEELRLVDGDDGLVATATSDAQGTLIFREVPVADGYRVADAETVSAAVDVTAADDPPDAASYADQEIGPGYGYVETRDGTLLAMNVTLPGPPENGPYPTVIEYSGYSPANPESPHPSTLIAGLLGFATVGVNLRGTGCSGGAFEFFETLQATDGYDVVETIASQPWVEHAKVGMVGLSYPGISQLFVAARRPPSLAAIAPLSVISDTGRGVLRPGGIYNDGFAQWWAEERKHDAEAAPASGQPWAGDRIEGGDTTCAANQQLRSQAPDILEMIDANQYWTKQAEALAPETFVDAIEVPVFLAGAWQDEQTGAYFANMLDDFTGTAKAWFTVTNGGHTDSLDPAVLARWIEFLQIYVGRDVPRRPATAATIAAVAGTEIWDVPVSLPPDRFANATSLTDAQEIFESDPRLRVLFENGAGAGPGLPYARFEAGFDEWPVPGTEARAWYFDAGSALVDGAPIDNSEDTYGYDASRAQVTTLPGTDNESTWLPLPPWDWPLPPEAAALAYESPPLSADVVMVGTGSVDLWLQADVEDVDVQVTLSEVRADGNEVLVQSGWLRASQRALADEATLLRPLHTNVEEDVAPLPESEWSEARVELFPFAHAFRAGSQIRVIVDTPGGTRPRWRFDVLDAPDGAQVQVARGGDYPSRIVLPVVPGVSVPPGLPPCPSLRGQPCRPYAAL